MMTLMISSSMIGSSVIVSKSSVNCAVTWVTVSTQPNSEAAATMTSTDAVVSIV